MAAHSHDTKSVEKSQYFVYTDHAMRILGIETSCDETAIAIIEIRGFPKKPVLRIGANVVSSQVKLHAKFGGVVPNLAKREHQRNLVPVLLTAFKEANFINSKFKNQNAKSQSKIQNRLAKILEREPELLARILEDVIPFRPPAVDALAVTIGPGLEPALWVGVNFARALNVLWKKPIIPVNHLEGHIYTNLITQIRESPNSKIPNPKQIRNPKSQILNGPGFRVSLFKFPALTLIVSGGHTELVLVSGYGKYKIVGETRDDAAGEAFDKVSKMLGLGYPGGPEISRLAEKGNPAAFSFPRPMISAKNFDFSFSGLKTAVLYKLRELGTLSIQKKRDIAASFEQAVVEVLVSKTLRAAKEHQVKTVMIAGGVAANRKLRREFKAVFAKRLPNVEIRLPLPTLTGDNGLMIALAGYFRRNKKTAQSALRADANLRLA